MSHRSDFALNIGIAKSSKFDIHVISFNSSAISISSLVVVADLNNKLSDNIHANIIVPISFDISKLFSLYILYKIEHVEQSFSILMFTGEFVLKFTLW
jgi:hypothetical protein